MTGMQKENSELRDENNILQEALRLVLESLGREAETTGANDKATRLPGATADDEEQEEMSEKEIQRPDKNPCRNGWSKFTARSSKNTASGESSGSD